jgi:hypothetical protein
VAHPELTPVIEILHLALGRDASVMQSKLIRLSLSLLSLTGVIQADRETEGGDGGGAEGERSPGEV